MANQPGPSPFKGLAYNYSPELVCQLKRRFRWYSDAHDFMVLVGITDQGPYVCPVTENGVQHFHLTTRSFDVMNYRAWLIRPKGVHSHRSREQRRRRKKRAELRTRLKKLLVLNKGQDHQTIMEEIELGF